MRRLPDPIYQIQDALTGRYSVKRELGKGGMAKVWLARDLYAGNGITFSLIAADLLLDLFLQRRNPDLEIFRFDR